MAEQIHPTQDAPDTPVGTGVEDTSETIRAVGAAARTVIGIVQMFKTHPPPLRPPDPSIVNSHLGVLTPNVQKHGLNSLAYAIARMRDALGRRCEVPLAKAIAAVSLGPPREWPGATALEAAYRLGEVVRLAVLDLCPQAGTVWAALESDSETAEVPNLDNLCRELSTPERYREAGLPDPNLAALDELRASVEREVARATAPSAAQHEWSRPVTVTELASVYDRSRNHLARLLRSGQITARKVGGRWQVALSELPAGTQDQFRAPGGAT